MSRSQIIKNQFDAGSVKVVDGTTPTPLDLTVLFDSGDFQIQDLRAVLKDVVAYQRRGTVTSVRHTSRVFPTGSFSLQVSEFSETSAGTLVDFITGKTGTPFAARVSTLSGDVMTCDITFTMEGTDLGDAADATFTLHDCHLVFGFGEGDPNTISVSFTVYGEVDGDIEAALAA